MCPTGALFRTEFGTVVVQQDICDGCGYRVPLGDGRRTPRTRSVRSGNAWRRAGRAPDRAGSVLAESRDWLSLSPLSARLRRS
ncbi:hypothetical protein SUDANB180_00849 [Streptomyces sp. enrichment culture]